MVDFRLCVISDRKRCESLEEVMGIACRAGVRLVQLREKDLESRPLFELAKGLRRVTSAHGARLVINDRVDIALGTASDGVHCPEDGFPPETAREILGAGSLIGASCHSHDAVTRAADAGVDFVFYGPVFATPSKATFGAPLGVESLRNVCARANVPVFAIGGVTPERSARCVEAGARGVAVISAVVAAGDIEAAVASFERALGGL